MMRGQFSLSNCFCNREPVWPNGPPGGTGNVFVGINDDGHPNGGQHPANNCQRIGPVPNMRGGDDGRGTHPGNSQPGCVFRLEPCKIGPHILRGALGLLHPPCRGILAMGGGGDCQHNCKNKLFHDKWFNW